MRIKHIGIIVNDIEKSIALYIKMGYELRKPIVFDYIQNNQVAIMESDILPNIELIEPINEDSSVANFKEGYHHICYEAEFEENIIQMFQKMKIGKIFTKPIVAPALDNCEVVFACLQNGTLVEFIL